MNNNFNLSEEDLDFLIELQHEMLTQDHVYQAAPRFWVVAGNKKVCVGREYAEGEQLIATDDYSYVLADGIEDAVKFFLEEDIVVYNEDNDNEQYECILEVDSTCPFKAWRVAIIDNYCNKESEDYVEGNEIEMEQGGITNIEELIDALTDAGVIRETNYYEVGHYRNEFHIYPDTMFLTNRSCKEHIKANYYHYSDDAHPYAMTAWRSPEVEKLWNILDKIDWKGIKANV